MKKFLLFCLTTFLSVATWAQTFSYGDLNYVVISEDSKTCEVTTGSYGSLTEVIVPETVEYNNESYTVIGIGAEVFYGANFTAIELPNSLIYINGMAFSYCENLLSIEIPAYVSGLGEDYGGCVFQYCSSLKTVTFLGSQITEILGFMFQGCSSLEEITIPNSVMEIGQYAFQKCSSLRSITLSNSLTKIGMFTFVECNSLQEIYSLNPTPPDCDTYAFGGHDSGAPEVDISVCTLYVPYGSVDVYGSAPIWEDFTNVVELPYVAPTLGDGDKFESDGLYYEVISTEDKTIKVTWGGNNKESGTPSYIGDIVIPLRATYDADSYSVIGIGEYAFANCNGLQSISFGTFNASSTVESIEQCAFYGCSSLESVTLSDIITELQDYTFYGCSSLENITIPNTVVSIGNYVFDGCSNLKTATISNAAKEIGAYAFSGCTSLLELYSLNPIPPSCDSTTFGDETSSSVIYSSCTLYVPEGISSYYSNAEVWEGFTNIEEMVIESRRGTFKYDGLCYEIVSSRNQEVQVTWGGETQESGTPYYLGEIEIPTTAEYEGVTYSVTGIGSYAFDHCINLTGVTIPTSIVNISTRPFSYCTSLKELKIPDSVTYIGSYLCAWCDNIEKVEISNSATYMGPYSFWCDGNLKDVTLGSSLATLEAYLFNECTSLTYVEIPSSVKELVACVFWESGIEEITIPETVTEVGVGTCQLCVNLKKAVVNCTNLGGNVFSNCTNLTDVTLGNTVEYLGGGAFQRCAFEHITIPESVKSTANSVFNGCANLKDLVFPNSFERIEDYIAQNCTSLQSVTIPKSVTSLGSRLFRYDTSLVEIYSFNPTPPTCDEDTFIDMDTEACVLYVPAGSRELYAEADQWKDFIHIVEVAYVETSEAEDVTVSSAILKGKVAEGDTPISTQGFEFWKDGLDNVITTISIEESDMSYTITNLDSETTYTYRAFATTEDGTTYYGDNVSFTTAKDTSTGIDNVGMGGINGENVEGIYSTSGQKLNTAVKGVNIVKYNDGTVKKIYVK